MMSTATQKYPVQNHTPLVRADEAADNKDNLVNHLLQNGYLTDQQITYARRVQSKLEVPPSLLQVIKELKYIADEQIKAALGKHPLSMPIAVFWSSSDISAHPICRPLWGFRRLKNQGENLARFSLIVSPLRRGFW